MKKFEKEVPVKQTLKPKLTGYDKYINYKTFSIAFAAFVIILMIPTPDSMVDVGVEYSMGETYVLDYFCRTLFGSGHEDAEQWQLMTARILEANMMQGTFSRKGVLKRDISWVKGQDIPVSKKQFGKYTDFVSQMDADGFQSMLQHAYSLRTKELTMDSLTPDQRQTALVAAKHVKICIAMLAFVVLCFITEAIPLPSVAFCVGLILVFSGMVSRENVAALYWSDACWFIMGSLMFAAAFVKTGVDKRICLFLFKGLAKPHVKWITLILIIVIAIGAAFISDHALAAMFLPIAVALYTNSVSNRESDTELAKMLVLTIAMACNIGGFGSPSGGARNVIMMSYMEGMFGIQIGYGEWMIYAFPFVIIMIPILWVLVNRLFKPGITDLGPALNMIKKDISHMGPWSRQQIIAVVIFLVMLFGWITEKNLIKALLGVRLGIGVIAVAGAVAYLLFGIVNWKDYQTRVDWGIVWLYAGAIILGFILDTTGAAYWLARTIIDGLAPFGLASGKYLLVTGGLVTAFLTNLMADGPAAACVGPITLNMAAVTGPGTTLIPFMGLITSCASSFAYLLIIGTPPNAIVYASGYLEPKDFLRLGIPCLIIASILIFLLSIFYWSMLGFQGMISM